MPRGEGSYDGHMELNRDQLFDLLMGRDFGRLREKVGRWEQQEPPLNAEGVPLWCVDLLPPCAEVQKFAFDNTWAPLAVLYGELQEDPSFVCPLAHTGKVKQAVQESVLRYLPSGCAAWEQSGTVYSMPASQEIFLPAPSMVANCVVHSEVPVIAGQVATLTTKKSLVTWPNVVNNFCARWRGMKALTWTLSTRSKRLKAIFMKPRSMTAPPRKRRRNASPSFKMPLPQLTKSRKLMMTTVSDQIMPRQLAN